MPVNKSFYKKRKHFLGTCYTRIPEYATPVAGSDVILAAPFYTDNKINKTGSRTTLTGTYNKDTSLLAGNVSVTLSTVNVTNEYVGFYPSIPDTWTVKSYVYITVGYYNGSFFVPMGKSAETLISTYTHSLGIATPLIPTPTTAYSLKTSYSSRITHIRVNVKTTIATASGSKKISELGILERQCNITTFFSETGTTTIATMMTDTNSLSLDFKVHNIFDYALWDMGTTGNTKENIRDYFNTEGTATAIVSFITPALAEDEFLVLTVNNPDLSLTDFNSANEIPFESFSGNCGNVPRICPNSTDITNERLCYIKDEQGHRGMFVVLLQSAKNWAGVTNSYSSLNSIVQKTDSNINNYRPWFKRIFMLQPKAKRTYIALGGLYPNAQYTFKVHVARMSTDSQFNAGGKSIWASIYLTLSPDSGTVWVDGNHRTWTDPNTNAPAGFWSNRAYRKLWLYNKIIIDSTQTSITAKTPPSRDLDDCARPTNIAVNIVDANLSLPPSSAVLTWETVKTLTTPDSWYICMSMPRYNFEYSWQISSDGNNISNVHPKVSSLAYNLSSDATNYYHTVTVETYQTTIPVDISFCIVGRIDGWIY